MTLMWASIFAGFMNTKKAFTLNNREKGSCTTSSPFTSAFPATIALSQNVFRAVRWGPFRKTRIMAWLRSIKKSVKEPSYVCWHAHMGHRNTIKRFLNRISAIFVSICKKRVKTRPVWHRVRCGPSNLGQSKIFGKSMETSAK